MSSAGERLSARELAGYEADHPTSFCQPAGLASLRNPKILPIQALARGGPRELRRLRRKGRIR